jgi:hypothetical protein
MVVCPTTTVASTGTDTQVGTELAVTCAQAVGKAALVKRTTPMGMPLRLNTVLSPGMTSNDCVVLQLPVEVMEMHATVPSLGTLVTAASALPTAPEPLPASFEAQPGTRSHADVSAAPRRTIRLLIMGVFLETEVVGRYGQVL